MPVDDDEFEASLQQLQNRVANQTEYVDLCSKYQLFLAGHGIHFDSNPDLPLELIVEREKNTTICNALAGMKLITSMLSHPNPKREAQKLLIGTHFNFGPWLDLVELEFSGAGVVTYADMQELLAEIKEELALERQLSQKVRNLVNSYLEFLYENGYNMPLGESGMSLLFAIANHKIMSEKLSDVPGFSIHETATIAIYDMGLSHPAWFALVNQELL